MTARDEVLARIRAALGSGTAGDAGAGAAGAGPPGRAPGAGAAAAGPPDGDAPGAGAAAAGLPDDDGVPRGYRTGAGLDAAALTDLLAERLLDYGAGVRRCPPAGVPAAVREALADRGVRRVVVPSGLDPDLAEGLDCVTAVPGDGLSPGALDAADGVITTAALAIAETGTIILDGGPGQGRRALSLVPDYHLCVLRAGQIVAIVPEAVNRLHPDRPTTWISGPSATSDIELDRVQGVHGPRTLDVILAGP